MLRILLSSDDKFWQFRSIKLGYIGSAESDLNHFSNSLDQNLISAKDPSNDSSILKIRKNSNNSNTDRKF